MASDPKVDWSALTPREVVDALDAAPKIALAWYCPFGDDGREGYWARKSYFDRFDTRECSLSAVVSISRRRTSRGSKRTRGRAGNIETITRGIEYRWTTTHGGGVWGTAETLAEAKSSADAALREAGWRLVDEEEGDRG